MELQRSAVFAGKNTRRPPQYGQHFHSTQTVPLKCDPPAQGDQRLRLYLQTNIFIPDNSGNNGHVHVLMKTVVRIMMLISLAGLWINCKEVHCKNYIIQANKMPKWFWKDSV